MIFERIDSLHTEIDRILYTSTVCTQQGFCAPPAPKSDENRLRGGRGSRYRSPRRFYGPGVPLPSSRSRWRRPSGRQGRPSSKNQHLDLFGWYIRRATDVCTVHHKEGNLSSRTKNRVKKQFFEAVPRVIDRHDVSTTQGYPCRRPGTDAGDLLADRTDIASKITFWLKL